MQHTKSQNNQHDDKEKVTIQTENTEALEISNEEETAPCCGCCGG